MSVLKRIFSSSEEKLNAFTLKAIKNHPSIRQDLNEFTNANAYNVSKYIVTAVIVAIYGNGNNGENFKYLDYQLLYYIYNHFRVNKTNFFYPPSDENFLRLISLTANKDFMMEESLLPEIKEELTDFITDKNFIQHTNDNYEELNMTTISKNYCKIDNDKKFSMDKLMEYITFLEINISGEYNDIDLDNDSEEEIKNYLRGKIKTAINERMSQTSSNWRETKKKLKNACKKRKKEEDEKRR